MGKKFSSDMIQSFGNSISEKMDNVADAIREEGEKQSKKFEEVNEKFSAQGQINNMIKKRISDAKKGVIKVRGNYQTIIIDPIMLCQHMFGQPIKGFLKENEIFNRFWVDKKVKEVVALRAPMVSYNNVKIVDIATSQEIEKWYGHLNGLVILNGCDTLCARLSGADCDK